MDWHTMDAGRALDRLIAERKGWRVEVTTANYTADGNIDALLLDDAGDVRAVYGCPPDDFDEITAIERVWQCGLDTPEWNINAVPYISDDLNLAIALVSDKDVTIENDLGKDTHPDWRWVVWLEGDGYLDGGSFEGHGHSPALAICRAWLAWQEFVTPKA
jgi:hypothetical protein